MKIITSTEKAKFIAELAAEKKATDIVLVDIRGIAVICDWFIIASAGSSRALNSISNFIQKKMSKNGRRPINTGGRRNPSWVLLDYEDVVFHIFNKDTRAFYELERLWPEARIERFDDLCLKKISQK